VLRSVPQTDSNRTKFTIFSSAVFQAHSPDGSTNAKKLQTSNLNN